MVGNAGGDTARIRVVLAEDHPIVLVGLHTVVSSQPDLELVGEAATADEVLALTRERRPDVVVLPLRLEGELKGVEICREIKSSGAAQVLIYTSYNSGEDAAACLLSGADSFVHKGEDPVRLLETIRATAAGRRVWLLGGETRDESSRVQRLVESSGLTRREQEVLGLVLQRRTNAEIAQELFLGLPTVKTHVSSILRKLGLRSRQELF
ncbi:response regulator [Pseudonocardia nigra]|uniref:response regulator n=1 Tax=Pseudonocardia nigra TaxID=1921578 RepID=UPI001C5D2F43|nr:response regulator transcription factor [Pseudonocardia nigra]